MKKSLSFVVLFVVLFAVASLQAQKASALTILNASGSATTSRPSPSSPVSTNYSSGVATLTVKDNLSTFLASDAARFYGPNQTPDPVTIATTSADKLTLFFTANTAAAHNVTAVIASPKTAMHQFVFTTQTAIPASGQIEIAYPTLASTDTDQASPSASSWTFNGLATGDIKSTQGSNCSWAITGTSASGVPKITCTTTNTIPANTVIWVFVGCATYTAGSTTCTQQKPLLINPTTTTVRGTADVKNIAIRTYQSSGGSILDSTTVKMGTIESVFVVAHVDPTFSFTIDGVAASTDLHTAQTCSASYANISTNATFPSTPTEVNLGTITSGGNTYAAQKFTVTSNTASGYVIIATSSGFLLNPPTGQYIVNAQGNVTANNTPVPTTISSTTGGYGINVCDANSRVNTTTWGQAAPNFANPSAQFYCTLVNYNGTIPNGTESLYVVYGARAAATTPPGDYWQIITYTASPTF